MITLCLHTAWSSEDLSLLPKSWYGAYRAIKLSYLLTTGYKTLIIYHFVCSPGPAVSPGQCETDTKPFHQLKEPQEMRGKPAKSEGRLILVCHSGRTTNHEVIRHVFQYESGTDMLKSIWVSKRKKDRSWESQADSDILNISACLQRCTD